MPNFMDKLRNNPGFQADMSLLTGKGGGNSFPFGGLAKSAPAAPSPNLPSPAVAQQGLGAGAGLGAVAANPQATANPTAMANAAPPSPVATGVTPGPQNTGLGAQLNALAAGNILPPDQQFDAPRPRTGLFSLDFNPFAGDPLQYGRLGGPLGGGEHNWFTRDYGAPDTGGGGGGSGGGAGPDIRAIVGGHPTVNSLADIYRSPDLWTDKPLVPGTFGDPRNPQGRPVTPAGHVWSGHLGRFIEAGTGLDYDEDGE